jgi:hypothetical protein
LVQRTRSFRDSVGLVRFAALPIGNAALLRRSVLPCDSIRPDGVKTNSADTACGRSNRDIFVQDSGEGFLNKQLIFTSVFKTGILVHLLVSTKSGERLGTLMRDELPQAANSRCEGFKNKNPNIPSAVLKLKPRHSLQGNPVRTGGPMRLFDRRYTMVRNSLLRNARLSSN